MYELQRGNWRKEVYNNLLEIITSKAYTKAPVIFDFDKTIINGDIEQATSYKLMAQGHLNSYNIPASLAPSFFLGENFVTRENTPDLKEYRRCYSQTVKTRIFYGWTAQVLGGLTCQQVVEATEQAYYDADNPEQPLVRPEMLDLLGAFLYYDYDVWIVSASPALMVRTIVMKVINKMLIQKNIPPFKSNHVLGINSQLKDTQENYYFDYDLVSNDMQFANLDPDKLNNLYYTNIIKKPISAYTGKVHAINNYIDSPLYFGAGDSANDVPFLRLCEHRLWLGQLKDPEAQKKLMLELGVHHTWLIQPVLPTKPPRFFTNKISLDLAEIADFETQVFESLGYFGF